MDNIGTPVFSIKQLNEMYYVFVFDMLDVEQRNGPDDPGLTKTSHISYNGKIEYYWINTFIKYIHISQLKILSIISLICRNFPS